MLCWGQDSHYTHELLAAVVTHTSSRQEDQSVFQQAAVMNPVSHTANKNNNQKQNPKDKTWGMTTGGSHIEGFPEE